MFPLACTLTAFRCVFPRRKHCGRSDARQEGRKLKEKTNDGGKGRRRKKNNKRNRRSGETETEEKRSGTRGEGEGSKNTRIRVSMADSLIDVARGKRGEEIACLKVARERGKKFPIKGKKNERGEISRNGIAEFFTCRLLPWLIRPSRNSLPSSSSASNLDRFLTRRILCKCRKENNVDEWRGRGNRGSLDN